MSGYEMPPHGSLTPESARVLPFRRPSRAVRVRRRSPWLALVRHFAQALLVVGTPVLAALWLFSSPTFAFAAVDFGESRYVERAWVEGALAPLVGENLLRLELAEVRNRLAEHPWVERVTVAKHLPNRLRVDLVEKRPAALLRGAFGLSYLGEDGRAIAPYDPLRGPGDLLLVSLAARGAGDAPGGDSAELAAVFALEKELAQARPEWSASLSEVEVLGAGDYRLHLAAFAHPLLVRGGTLAARFADLEPLLPELARRYERLAFIDLRFDRRIIFQPAPPAPPAPMATPRERTPEWPSQNSTS
jgi:cell division protein FtsQ